MVIYNRGMKALFANITQNAWSPDLPIMPPAWIFKYLPTADRIGLLLTPAWKAHRGRTEEGKQSEGLALHTWSTQTPFRQYQKEVDVKCDCGLTRLALATLVPEGEGHREQSVIFTLTFSSRFILASPCKVWASAVVIVSARSACLPLASRNCYWRADDVEGPHAVLC